VDDISALARSYGKEALLRTVQAMRNEDDKIAVPAAIELMNRGYGKPRITIESDGAPTLSLLHLIAAKDVSERVAAILRGESEAAPPLIEAQPEV
jgi:hypothetical protein